MSMILALTAIDESTALLLKENPLLIWRVLGVVDDEHPMISKPSSRTWLSRLFGGEPEPDGKAELHDLNGIEEIDLDKAWQGIHYLLTETGWEGDPPLSFLICGGTEVGDIDVGYGPARLVDSGDVAKVDEALRTIDRQYLLNNFSPAKMMELDLYPSIWDRPTDSDDPFGYCAEYFEELKDFVARCAEEKRSIVISIQ